MNGSLNIGTINGLTIDQILDKWVPSVRRTILLNYVSRENLDGCERSVEQYRGEIGRDTWYKNKNQEKRIAEVVFPPRHFAILNQGSDSTSSPVSASPESSEELPAVILLIRPTFTRT